MRTGGRGCRIPEGLRTSFMYGTLRGVGGVKSEADGQMENWRSLLQSRQKKIRARAQLHDEAVNLSIGPHNSCHLKAKFLL